MATTVHLAPFTGTNGDNATALTPTTGSAHTKISGVANAIVQDNRVFASGGATYLYSTVDVPTYPYQVKMSVHLLSKIASQKSTINVGGATTTTSFWINWNAGTADLSSALGSQSVTVSTGVTYELQIIVHSATTFTCYLDGAVLFGGMITRSTMGTVQAVRYRNEDAAGTTTTGAHIDSIQVVNLTNYSLTADEGTYTLSGQAAGLLASRVLTAAEGSYALSGQAAGLLRSLVLTADHGTYTLSGQDATLLVARLLVAAEGAYTVAGQDALLLASRLLTADGGTYTLSGQDADLIYSGSNPTLVAEAGLYTLSGQDALLLASRVLTAEHGSYALTGQDALLLASRLLTAEHATYTLSGQAAALLVSRGLVAEAGTYTVSGQDALLLASRILTASHGSYVLTGQDATLTAAAAVLPAAILVVDASGRRLLAIDVSARRLVLDADDSARRVIVLAQPLLPQ